MNRLADWLMSIACWWDGKREPRREWRRVYWKEPKSPYTWQNALTGTWYPPPFNGVELPTWDGWHYGRYV